MKEEYLKQIKTASRMGLIGSVLVVAATIAWVWLSKYTFRQTNQVHTAMLVASCVLAIGGMSWMLLSVRRNIPQIRQLDSIEERLRRYCSQVKGMYYGMLCIILVLCMLCVLMGNRNILMLILLVTLTLFMAFPNVYRMKVDLGLTDEQAREMFGDRYIPDPKPEEERSEEEKKDE